MRRWNGWGDETNSFPLRKSAVSFLETKIGTSAPLPDASLDDVMALVPESRLEEHPLVDTSAEVRIRHTRGQSLPDWLAMRSGRFTEFPKGITFPDGVAMPESREEIREILRHASENNIELVIYGGGTSVAGHINPLNSERPVLTLSLEKMSSLLHLDVPSQLATFQPGATGPEVEEQLNARGYTLGHFPQSFELSTVGGWVATRSSGQQSLRYGRIEQMFAGGTVETFDGSWEIPPIPASAAGPDMREWIMGSEGRFGVISEVIMRVSKMPEHESFHVAFFPDWESAKRCAMRLVHHRVPLSMVRVSNPVETDTHLRLGADQSILKWVNRYLNARHCVENEKCMLTYGVTGDKKPCKQVLAQARSVIKEYDGVDTGELFGKRWEHSRFRSPYLRHGLWEHGYAVDTLETSANWNNIDNMMKLVEKTIRQASKPFSPVHVFSHLSHMYRQGASIYTTYAFPVSENYDRTYEQWRAIKTSTSQAIIDNGGTISHQHGVGQDHAAWLEQEKGPFAIKAIEAVRQQFDQKGLLNPKVMLDE